MLQDSLFISLHESGFLKVIRDAVPISNTKVSVLLRAATLEAQITWQLAKYLFQPLFPWSSAPDERSNILEELFDGVLEVDARKAAVLRSIISTTKTKDGEDREREVIKSIIDTAIKLCAPILTLSQRDLSAELQRDLENFLRGGIEVWNRAQRTQSRVMATSEFDNAEISWVSREEHDQLGHTQDTYSPIKALYPQVCQSVSNEYSPLHSGSALWSDQELYAAGRSEYQAQSRRISSQYSGALTGPGGRRLYVSRSLARITSHTRNKS
jgi:hypothetical protein